MVWTFARAQSLQDVFSKQREAKQSSQRSLKGKSSKLDDMIIALHGNYTNEENLLSLFFTGRICLREQRKKQPDWLATNTDVITSQSHSLFACSRENHRQVENGF